MRPQSTGRKTGASENELAFYAALETNDSAVQVLGDETLRAIAQELVETARRNATIDWTVRGECPGWDEECSKEGAEKAWVPAGQAGKGGADGTGTGGVAVSGVGDPLAVRTLRPHTLSTGSNLSQYNLPLALPSLHRSSGRNHML